MKASDLIKKAILEEELLNPENNLNFSGVLADEDIDALWWTFEGLDEYWEVTEEFRCSGERTDIPSDWNRNYESFQAARKIGDQWVGWTYWYGGGKHGSPERVEWIDHAYFLDIKEEQVTITKRTFSKVEG